MSSTRKTLHALAILAALLVLGAAEAKADPLVVTIVNPTQNTPFQNTTTYVTLTNNTTGSIAGINYLVSLTPNAQAIVMNTAAPAFLAAGESWGPLSLFTTILPFGDPFGSSYSGLLTVNYTELQTGQRSSITLPFQINLVREPEPQPTPEPATALLLVTGLAGAGARAARRRRRPRG